MDKVRLWFAASDVYEGEWHFGPYTSKEAAAQAYIKKYALNAGDWLFVGYLVTHKPTIAPDTAIEILLSDERLLDGYADDWLAALTEEDKTSLGTLLDLAVMAWLEKIDRVPVFGVIEGVQEVILTDDGLVYLDRE